MPLKTLILTLVLTFATSAWAMQRASPCIHELVKGDNLTFDNVDDQIRIMRANGAMGSVISEAELNRFWREGWPFLKNLAAENDSKISEILEDYISIVELFSEATASPHYRQIIDSNTQLSFDSVRSLEALPAGAKMKARQWQEARRAYALMRLLAFMAVAHEATYLDRPTLHPAAVPDGVQIRLIFESLENISLDQTLKAVQYAKGSVIEEPPQETSITPVIPVISATPAIPVPPEKVETELPTVLVYKLPLTANLTYSAVNTRKENYDVVLTDELVRDEKKDSAPVRKLLGTIISGTGIKSGIKVLSDLGKDIIELKAVMHGHKRVIGCLKGRTLTLIRLMDIKADRATYARRIPSNLCAGI